MREISKKNSFVLGGVISIVFLLVIFYIVPSPTPATDQKTIQTNIDSGDPFHVTVCPIEDYGNGVLYFDCRGGLFATELSSYLSVHNNSRVVSITPVPDGGRYNSINGYIVVMETTGDPI